VANLVVVPRQVYVQLVVVVIPEQLQHTLIQLLLLHDRPHHVAVNKLVNLLHGHVHPMISRYVPFQLQKVASHIVNVDEGELFVDVVLGDIDVEVVVAVVLQARSLRAWPHI